jgi:hypothetical protein
MSGKIVTRHRAQRHRWSAAAFTRGPLLRRRSLFLLGVVPEENSTFSNPRHWRTVWETIFKAEDGGKLITVMAFNLETDWTSPKIQSNVYHGMLDLAVHVIFRAPGDAMNYQCAVLLLTPPWLSPTLILF